MVIDVIKSRGSNEEEDERRTFISARYLMAIMACMGNSAIYGFKVNVSVAIVAMVNHTAIRDTNYQNDRSYNDIRNVTAIRSPCRSEEESRLVDDNVTGTTLYNDDGPFAWEEPLQGLVLSAYFWSYLISQLPGGRAAELVSAKWVLNGAVIVNAIACILSPWGARVHYGLFMALRFLQGLSGGVVIPALHVIIAKWTPPDERPFITSIVYSGGALGNVVSTFLSGLLAADYGWSAVFYVQGSLALVWCAAWSLIVQDSPEQQTRFITRSEKDYIANALGNINDHPRRTEKRSVPWKYVFRSRPFWAILVSNVCGHFGWFMMMTELPTFMNQILQFDLKQNALYSALPYLCMWLFVNLFGKLMETMITKGWITLTRSRKIATFIGSFVPMCCLLGVTYVGCDRDLAVFLMTFGMTAMGGMFCGALSNHIDIAPNFAGTLVGFTNTIASISGFVVPLLVGKLTHRNRTIEPWRTAFFVTGVMYAIDILAYLSMGSAEEQPWNDLSKIKDVELIKDVRYRSEMKPLDPTNEKE